MSPQEPNSSGPSRETPLARKLGIRADARVAVLGAPPGFEQLLEPLPEGVRLLRRPRRSVDVTVVFADTRRRLEGRFPRALRLLPPEGGLWVAWPKKASGVPTDLDFATVQAVGLGAGLVDNKSCSVDATWTALRFVVRRQDRRSRASPG